MAHIECTYEIVTPESAEDGDFAEHGYISPGGHDHPLEPSCVGEKFKRWKEENVVPCWEYDPDDADSKVEQAVRFLQSGGYVEPSSNFFEEGLAYNWMDARRDPFSGESRMEAAHLVGFTVAEEEAIFNWIVKGS